MASLRIVFPSFSLILLFSLFTFTLGGVPVLIWDSSDISEKDDLVPALSHLDGDEFSNRLMKKVHAQKPLVVVFVSETLSVEDFSWKDDRHQGAFPKLENITGMAAKMEFIPSVIDPINALKDLFDSEEYTYWKYDRANPKNKPNTALEVALPDPYVSEDRPQLLRRHDADIARIYSDLLASAPRIIAIFTGRQNSWVEADVNRVRRQANSTDRITLVTKSAMLSAASAKLILGNQTYDLGPAAEIKTDERANFSRIIYIFYADDGNKTKITLRIKFSNDKPLWSIPDSDLEVRGREEGPLFPKTKVSAGLGSAFSAPEEIVFQNLPKNATLIFNNFKAEKFARVGQANFSATENQFFTAPIWMGLFVSWTLLIILTWGITMLMDIKTMDRFDDPKGKTITVNTSE